MYGDLDGETDSLGLHKAYQELDLAHVHDPTLADPVIQTYYRSQEQLFISKSVHSFDVVSAKCTWFSTNGTPIQFWKLSNNVSSNMSLLHLSLSGQGELMPPSLVCKY